MDLYDITLIFTTTMKSLQSVIAYGALYIGSSDGVRAYPSLELVRCLYCSGLKIRNNIIVRGRFACASLQKCLQLLVIAHNHNDGHREGTSARRRGADASFLCAVPAPKSKVQQRTPRQAVWHTMPHAPLWKAIAPRLRKRRFSEAELLARLRKYEAALTKLEVIRH